MAGWRPDDNEPRTTSAHVAQRFHALRNSPNPEEFFMNYGIDFHKNHSARRAVYETQGNICGEQFVALEGQLSGE